LARPGNESARLLDTGNDAKWPAATSYLAAYLPAPAGGPDRPPGVGEREDQQKVESVSPDKSGLKVDAFAPKSWNASNIIIWPKLPRSLYTRASNN